MQNIAYHFLLRHPWYTRGILPSLKEEKEVAVKRGDNRCQGRGRRKGRPFAAPYRVAQRQ